MKRTSLFYGNFYTDHKTKISLILCLFLCLGCGSLGTTHIKDILDHPRDYEGKILTIRGEVTQVMSLMVIKYFYLKDETGEMIVVTDRPLPNKGEKIKVKGTVKEAFSIGDQHYTVLIEESLKRK